MNKYGPNSPQVELFIDRLKVLTDEEVERITARSAAWSAAWIAAWSAAWITTRDAAWDAAWDVVWDTTREATWDAARDAARATASIAARDAQVIVVMDLITEEQFTILTEPFAEILVELGIVWEGK
jgi:hypothetical protein